MLPLVLRRLVCIAPVAALFRCLSLVSAAGFVAFFASVCATVFAFALTVPHAFAQAPPANQAKALSMQVTDADRAWADAVLHSLTLEEKIAQLIMVPAYSADTRHGKRNDEAIERLIREYRIGGLIFMQGSPGRQAALTNRFQKLSQLPLLISTDAEWGLAMRLDSVPDLPRAMTLGAVADEELLYDLGREMARQCRAVGTHINFAPVVDVNNNANNPVINFRSFGEDRDQVARRGVAIASGLQDGGVMACAKHFPGHGDTDTDSHHDLPVIRHNRIRLEDIEMYPFGQLQRAGVASVMVAHLAVPALDATPHLPATLSPLIVQKLLRDSMRFEGLIFTDALNMEGVRKHFEGGEIEVMALLAGNDVLLYVDNVPRAIKAIAAAIKEGRLTEGQLNEHVRRVLMWKARLCIDQSPLVDAGAVAAELNRPEVFALRRKLYRSALTLVRNEGQLLPLSTEKARRVLYVQTGYAKPTPFYESLSHYGAADFVYLSPDSSEQWLREQLVDWKDFYSTLVVSSMNLTQKRKKRYGIEPILEKLVHEAAVMDIPIVLVHFGNPYALEYFGAETATLVAYEEQAAAQVAAAEAIYGALEPRGRLPISLPGRYRHPVTYEFRGDRLAVSSPIDGGVDSAAFGRIDTVAQYYIREKAMPGCAVFGVCGNEVVLARGYGATEYDGGKAIDPWRTIYDLASVTKVCATTISIMRLFERDSIDIEAPLGKYLPEFSKPASELPLRLLLEHRSGFPAFIPFYLKTLKRKQHDPDIYAKVSGEYFNIALAPDLYLHNKYPEEVWRQILKLDPDKAPTQVYSDINFIILGKVIERITGQTLEQYTTQQFYQPLGMNHTLYLPAQKGVTVVPTENDQNFRFRRVDGYVNDEAAALLGGYAGHAGLFSSAGDLAKLLFMLKNGGQYGGQQFLKPETIAFFTATAGTESRRGLGWDKSEPRPDYPQPTPPQASPETYGHLGFTGTAVWVDPVNDLMYVILANRTFPSRENKLYVLASVRTKIMEALWVARQKWLDKYAPLPELVLE